MNTGKALLGVLAGVATGAVLGMIFAPSRRSHSRKNISKKSEDLAKALNDTIDERFDELVTAITGKVKKSKSQNGSIPTGKIESVE